MLVKKPRRQVGTAGLGGERESGSGGLRPCFGEVPPVVADTFHAFCETVSDRVFTFHALTKGDPAPTLAVDTPCRDNPDLRIGQAVKRDCGVIWLRGGQHRLL